MNFDNEWIIIVARSFPLVAAAWGLTFIIVFFENRSPAVTIDSDYFKRVPINLSVLAFSNLIIPRLFIFPQFFSRITEQYNLGVLNYYNIDNVWVHIAVVFICRSFLGWFIHFIFHKYRLLWRFHATHHSDYHMDVWVHSRFHIINQASSFFLIGPFFFLTGVSLTTFIIWDILWLFWNMWSHSNLSVPYRYRKYLEWIIHTPDTHRVHHSSDLKVASCNYGVFFSFWDRLFGTYCPSMKDVSNFKMGIENLPKEKANNYWNVLITGFSPDYLDSLKKPKED